MKKLYLVLLALCVGEAYASCDIIMPVEHSDTSVILRFPLYDVADPTLRKSGITSSTAGLEVNVSTDVTAGWYDQFRQSDSTLETIATIGTYSTPTATKARIGEVATGSGLYELQLPDAAFAVSNANQMQIAVDDGGTLIIDDCFLVDLTVVTGASLVDDVWDEILVSAHTTTNSAGDQLGAVLDSVETGVNTTNNSLLDSITVQAKRTYLYSAAIDSVTSQTAFVVDAASDPGVTDLHQDRWACVEDANDSDLQDCARIAGFNTTTDTWTIDGALGFTVAAGDVFFIPAPTNDLLEQEDLDNIEAELMQSAVDGSIDLQCALALTLAYTSGKWTRSGNVVTYRNPGDTANRVVGTIDADVSWDSITLTCP